MTIENWLRTGTTHLGQAGIETARLDALILLEDVLKKDRAWLLANPATEISPAIHGVLKKVLSRRVQHEPLAYIRGKAEFYGRDFVITPAVLQPRPESEAMIEELKTLPNLGTQPRIADVGCGSGALGITAALELPNSAVTLLDIDRQALQIAQTNVDKFTINTTVRRQNLLLNDPSRYDVLLCNLPYVPDDYPINDSAAYEPPVALFGGQDGLNLYRSLFSQVAATHSEVLYILTESLPSQHDALAGIAKRNHYDLVTKNDFIQVFRRTQK